jgi:hypothetical protein
MFHRGQADRWWRWRTDIQRDQDFRFTRTGLYGADLERSFLWDGLTEAYGEEDRGHLCRHAEGIWRMSYGPQKRSGEVLGKPWKAA